MMPIIILKIKEEEEERKRNLRGDKDKLPIGGDDRHLKAVPSELDGDFILKLEHY